MIRTRHLLPGLFALALLAGCSGSGDGPVAAPTAASTGAATKSFVVVPELDPSASAVAGDGVTVPTAATAAVTETAVVDSTQVLPNETPATETPTPATSLPATSLPGTPPSTAAVPTPETVPAPTPTTPSSPGATPPATTTAAATAPTTPAAPTGQAISVELSGCDGCSVIASHQDVAGGYSAALISRAGRGAVVSVAADGQVRGVANIPYGASFPAPTGALLPCDDSGRCVITAAQSDGSAVLSVFSLDSNGQWTDLSGDSGYPSVTDRATAVDLDGTFGLAVQDSDGSSTVWLVLRWNGETFLVAGCAPDGPVPAAADLSQDDCLS